MLFFRNFPVANNLMNKRGGESIKTFRRQFFVSQCQKRFFVEHFSVSKVSGIEKCCG